MPKQKFSSLLNTIITLKVSVAKNDERAIWDIDKNYRQGEQRSQRDH
jgi:hypothetical protein